MERKKIRGAFQKPNKFYKELCDCVFETPSREPGLKDPFEGIDFITPPDEAWQEFLTSKGTTADEHLKSHREIFDRLEDFYRQQDHNRRDFIDFLIKKYFAKEITEHDFLFFLKEAKKEARL